MENEQLEIQREIAIAEAKSKVYDEHARYASSCSDGGSSQGSRSRKRKSKPSEHNIPRNSTAPIPHEQENVEQNISSYEGNLIHLNDLCQLLKIQSAPDVDMDYFSGDPLEYRYFISLFEELVEKKVDDSFGKLARLIKYTRGEAKELIQHCIQLPQPDGFNVAKIF